MSFIASKYLDVYKSFLPNPVKAEKYGYSFLCSFIIHLDAININDYLESVKEMYYHNKEFFYKYPNFRFFKLFGKKLLVEKPIDFYNFAIRAFPHHKKEYNALKFNYYLDLIKNLLEELKNERCMEESEITLAKDEIVDSENQEEKENEKCVFCFINKKSNAFTRCGHMCLCDSCAESYKDREEDQCPMCRKRSSIIKIYI